MANVSSTADEILRCARSLIIGGGYNGFSYADISAVVGIRKASIHHHFPSKVDLVRAVVQRHIEEAAAGMAALDRHHPDPADRLRAYAGYWAECVHDPANAFCVCALLASQIPVLPQEVVVEVRAHFRALSDWLTLVIAEGAKQGRLNLSCDARSEAEIFMAAVHGAMLSARAYGDDAAFRTIVTPLIDRLVADHDEPTKRAAPGA